MPSPQFRLVQVGFSETLALGLSFGKSGLCGRRVAAGSLSSEGSMKRVGGRPRRVRECDDEDED